MHHHHDKKCKPVVVSLGGGLLRKTPPDQRRRCFNRKVLSVRLPVGLKIRRPLDESVDCEKGGGEGRGRIRPPFWPALDNSFEWSLTITSPPSRGK